MTEPAFKLFPVGDSNIEKASIVPNTTCTQYLAWLTKYVPTIEPADLHNFASYACKNGLYSFNKWKQEKDDQAALIAAQTKIAKYLYNGTPLRKYKKKILKNVNNTNNTSKIKKNPDKSLLSDTDNDSIIEDTNLDDVDDSKINNNNQNNIDINNLVNNPVFIKAIRSLTGNPTPQPLFNKRPRPLTLDDEISLELNPSKRTKFNPSSYLPPNPYITSNNDHLLQPDPKVVKLLLPFFTFLYFFYFIYGIFFGLFFNHLCHFRHFCHLLNFSQFLPLLVPFFTVTFATFSANFYSHFCHFYLIRLHTFWHLISPTLLYILTLIY